MKCQPEAIENFLGPVRENLVEARERFDAFMAQPRNREEQVRIRRRLVGGAFGLFALAGATAYIAGVSSEQAYWEASVNEGIGAAGDLVAVGAFIWAGSRLLKASTELNTAPASQSVTVIATPECVSYKVNECRAAVRTDTRFVTVGAALNPTPVSPAIKPVDIPVRILHEYENNEYKAAA